MYETIDEFWNEYTSFTFTSNMPGGEYLFRGVTDTAHLLIPSIGRDTAKGVESDIHMLEDNLLAEFKRLTAPVIDESLKTDIEWLFLAQHYGLPTRLLDWSTNPLVALYFAAEHSKADGCVYVCKRTVEDRFERYDFKNADYSDEFKAKNPLWRFVPLAGDVVFLRPRYVDQRYLNQRSVFSCPKDPFNPLELADLQQFSFKGEWKPQLLERLRAMGISTAHIYPGLEGIAKEIKLFSFDPVVAGRHIMGRSVAVMPLLTIPK